MPGWKAIHVDDAEAVPWQGTELVWRPLRHALGARLAGLAAFTASRAGQVVVEPHRESADGRGRGRHHRARFGRRSDVPSAGVRVARAGAPVSAGGAGREILAELHAERPGSPGDLIGRALPAASSEDGDGAAVWLREVLAAHPEYREALLRDPQLGAYVP